jgi:hypothetical protein
MIGALFNLLIYLLILGVLWWLIDYALTALPVPEPFAKIIRVVVVVIFALILITLLLSLVGVGGNFHLPRLTG